MNVMNPGGFSRIVRNETPYSPVSGIVSPLLRGAEAALIPEANAATGNPVLAYLKGNYNGIAAKTISGSTVYLVATPSIITSQSGATGSGFDIINDLPSKLLVH